MKRKIFHIAAYAVLLALAVWIEHGGELGAPSGCSGPEENSERLAPAWYEHLSQAGYSVPRAQLVRVVSLSPGAEPQEILDNVCKQRLFLAALIDKLKENRAALIVVDKFFSADSCPPDVKGNTDPGTAALQKTVSESQIPLIFGVQTDELDGSGEAATRGACLVPSAHPLFDPNSPPSAHLKFGLTRLNSDTRKIPLQWPVLPPNDSSLQSASQAASGAAQSGSTPAGTNGGAGKEAEMKTGLALAAAEQYDRDLAGDDAIKSLLKNRVHPFSTFIPQSQMMTLSASEVLCGKALGRLGDWQHCTAPANPAWADEIAGHIVVIGEFTPRDRHESVIGPVAGVLLQASYIEALLKDKYFKPVSTLTVTLLFAVWVAMLYALFWWLEPPELAVIVAVVILGILWITSYWALLQWRYFLAFSIQSSTFAAILIKWIEVRGHLLREHKK